MQRLSTFGVLAYLEPAELMEIFDLSERHFLLTKTTRGRVALTEDGAAVMRGESPIPEGLITRMIRRWREEEVA